jgi:CRAL/TRIO domain
MLSGLATSAPQKTVAETRAEFEALSPEEKECVYRDVYGAGNYAFVEDDDEISDCLTAFEKSLSDISNDEKKCYSLALEASPDYVNDRVLQLKFLRCEFFDARVRYVIFCFTSHVRLLQSRSTFLHCRQKAAARFASYWNDKVKIWGTDKAFRIITLEDFEEEDQVALSQGGMICLDEKDKFGRGIYLANRTKFAQGRSHRKSHLRVLWYLMECLVEDIEVQRNGIVCISGLGPKDYVQHQDRKLDYMATMLLRKSLPMRMVAFHKVITSKLTQFVIPFLLYLLGPEYRRRTKIHTDLYNIFNELQKYGIEKSTIPKEFGGDSAFEYSTWLYERRLQH